MLDYEIFEAEYNWMQSEEVWEEQLPNFKKIKKSLDKQQKICYNKDNKGKKEVNKNEIQSRNKNKRRAQQGLLR